MNGQHLARAALEQAIPAPDVDDVLLEAAGAVIAEHGLGGLTLARLADVAGVSRMTLHRRNITIAHVVTALSVRAAGELRDAVFPALVGTDPADRRLRLALEAMCGVADRHLPLLAGLFAADDGVFHAEPDDTGALPTDAIFVAPFAKLLADGAADGSLGAVGDPTEVATVLFNVAGWGYVQLRHAQRWPAERARNGVLDLVLSGLTHHR